MGSAGPDAGAKPDERDPLSSTSDSSSSASSPALSYSPLPLDSPPLVPQLKLMGLSKRRPRSGSDSTATSIDRARAGSVGVEGPLFGQEPLSPSGEHDALQDERAYGPVGGAKFGMTRADLHQE